MSEMKTLKYDQFLKVVHVLKEHSPIVSMEFHKDNLDIPYLSLQDRIKKVEVVDDPFGPDCIVIMMENSELTFVATDSFGIDLSDYQVFLFAGGVICWTWVNSDHLPLAATEAIDNIIKGE